MPELMSMGLDVGTSTTSFILSRLQVQNLANSFSVPQMQITERQILYKSPVYFTPLLDENRVDGAAIRAIVEKEYEKAGIDRKDVDTGAVIITGETSRKENARAVLRELSGFAGDFVVATAGPDLESILAAKGAGAVAWSEKTGKTVLHMDIGGGTSNLALIRNGRIEATGCVNVGGRLLILDQGIITYRSPVLQGLTDLQVGDKPTLEQLQGVAQMLVQCLEMAAGLTPKTDLLDKLMTREVGHPWEIPPPAVISFSGGVADCIREEKKVAEFGDIGPLLGTAIRQSKLCRGEYILGQETIHATVIGAGSYSTQLSGSTVYVKDVKLPMQNLPVVAVTEEEQLNPDAISRRLQQADGQAVLFCPGFESPDYGKVKALAQAIFQSMGNEPAYICVQTDMAKALGQYLSLLRPPESPCLCMDGLCLTDDSYLDVGSPVGPALPVIIKTLVLNQS